MPLSPEELEEQLSKLTPEQREEFVKQQEQLEKQCPFCLISEGKIQASKVYEDELLIAVLDINPANFGHILVFPKNHYKTTFEMPEEDIKKFFFAINKLAQELGKIVGAEGINIYAAYGEAAGQRVSHFIIHVIPRFRGDGLNFTWNPRKIPEEKNNEIVEKFKDFKLKEETVQEEENPWEFDFLTPEDRIPDF